jgi:uncharacterized protein YeaO (DUF488 family)
MKEVSPSTELRRWYGHQPGKFGEFASRDAKHSGVQVLLGVLTRSRERQEDRGAGDQ